MSTPTRKLQNFRPTVPDGPKFTQPRKGVEQYKTKEWVQHRRKFLDKNPLCHACGYKSTVVDHLVPHKGDFELFWKADNLIPLCQGCHNTATNLFDRNYKPGAPIKDKLEWLAWRRAGFELRSRVIVVPMDRPKL